MVGQQQLLAAGAFAVVALWIAKRRAASKKAPPPLKPLPSLPSSSSSFNSAYGDDASPTVIIGVAGGSASGKSFFASTLAERFTRLPGCFCVNMSHDFYYKDQAQVDEECNGNWDCPQALHTQEMAQDIETLRAGGAIKLPHYDFSVSARDPARATEVVPPKASEGQLVVILVEGLMIFHDEQLRDVCQLRVFIDCDEDTRFMRRLSRDTDDIKGGRGRSVQSVYAQWTEVVKPAHNQYVEPTKRCAHVVVPSRGLVVPTHLRRRTSVTRAAGALLSPAKGAPWQPREDGMMMPALQLIEAYVRERAAVAMGQGGGGA